MESKFKKEDNVEEILNKKIAYWMKKLIDLSGRNKLISYKPRITGSLKVSSPTIKKILDELDNEHKILINKRGIEEKDFHWVSADTDEKTAKSLEKVYLDARRNFQEQGINTCFAVLGLLQYFDKKTREKALETPIFLYPLEINKMPTCPKEYQRYEILSRPGELILNPALKQKLDVDFGVKIKDMENGSIMDYIDYLKKSLGGVVSYRVDVKLDCFIDVLSYQKFVMYNDIEKNTKYLQKSKIAKRYVGDASALKEQNFLFDEQDNESYLSVDVLPADSSQKRAIELAKKGVSYVLQGPPGTGKSQTIVNIISALISQKKKVLFVSQKMAALNVVQKRLDNVGLGMYCLNLHKFCGDKKDIIVQLMNTLMSSPVIKENVKRYTFNNYLNDQKQVDEYYAFISKKYKPRSYSIYELRGELSKLSDVEYLDVDINSVVVSDEENFKTVYERVKKIGLLCDKIDTPFDNIYYSFNVVKNNLIDRTKFSSLLKNSDRAFKLFNSKLIEIKNKTGLDIKSIKEINQFVQIETSFSENGLKDIPDFLVVENFEEVYSFVIKLKKYLKDINQIQKKILEDTDIKFLKVNTNNIYKIFQQANIIERWFDSEYKNSKKELKNYKKVTS